MQRPEVAPIRPEWPRLAPKRARLASGRPDLRHLTGLFDHLKGYPLPPVKLACSLHLTGGDLGDPNWPQSAQNNPDWPPRGPEWLRDTDLKHLAGHFDHLRGHPFPPVKLAFSLHLTGGDLSDQKRSQYLEPGETSATQIGPNQPRITQIGPQEGQIGFGTRRFEACCRSL